MPCVCWFPGLPGAEATGGCEPPDMGAGNVMWVLWMSHNMLLTGATNSSFSKAFMGPNQGKDFPILVGGPWGPPTDSWTHSNALSFLGNFGRKHSGGHGSGRTAGNGG